MEERSEACECTWERVGGDAEVVVGVGGSGERVRIAIVFSKILKDKCKRIPYGRRHQTYLRVLILLRILFCAL